MKKKPMVTRRQFVGAAAGAATCMIVPRHAVAQSGKTPPSEKLRIAGIGVGGQGGEDLKNLSNENIVALCDVDRSRHSAASFEMWPKARQYRDFRKMFDEIEKQIDAVLVATPDHTHAVAAMWIFSLGGVLPLCATAWRGTIIALAAAAAAATNSRRVTDVLFFMDLSWQTARFRL